MDAVLTKEEREIYQQEHAELCTTIRHYSALRFASLTVFLVFTAGLVVTGFGQVQSNQLASWFLPISIRIGGVIAVVSFWIFEARLVAYISRFGKRASKLEIALGYQLYSALPHSKLPFLNTPFAVRLLYISIMIFWLLSFFV